MLFHNLGKDSVQLSLNEQYELIEDSCAQILRYAHFSFKARKFFGSFKDVSHANPSLILSEGRYTADGLKEGQFTSHYLNGTLQSKGFYKNNKFDGHWEIYAENGKPKLIFEANDNEIRIMDAWDASGKKIVDNGKGTFAAISSYVTWKGKLENGKPDGTWHALKTNDATETYIANEHFKKGQFQKGTIAETEYADASRIILVSEDLLSYVNIEKMHVSMIACDGSGLKKFTNAQCRQGWESFSDNIQRLVTPYISKVDISSYENQLTIHAEVSNTGIINNFLANNAFDDNLARGIINQLRNLPNLEPATLDGKPVVQKIIFNLNFKKGLYTYNYQLLSLTAN